MRKPVSPATAGGALAVLAALAFGVTVPVIRHAGRGVGPSATAALLYLGACLSALSLGGLGRAGPPLRRADAARLAAIALLGAALAPTLLAWGLQRTPGVIAALLLNLEALFTVALARMVYGEPIGPRMMAALALIGLGGVTLTWQTQGALEWSALGALAICAATLAWALDNTLTRQLAEREPMAVIAVKSALGATLTGTLAALAGEPRPAALAAAVLIACGATGYGLSLRFYLLAQRRMGAARTGSVFALAPFVGAATAWLAGDRAAAAPTALATLLFAAGVSLHLTERHRHSHVHPALEHDHSHRHDDGHHDHAHNPPFFGEHAHPHRHELLEHDHDHAPDVHHGHPHRQSTEPTNGSSVR